MYMGSPIRPHEEPKGADCHFCQADAVSSCARCFEPICESHTARCGCEGAQPYCLRCAEKRATPLMKVNGEWICMECERKCASCGETWPASSGLHVKDDFFCETCRAALDAAKAINYQLSRRSERIAITVEAAALEAKSKEITERMEAREKAKTDAIACAQMPVEGLGFGEGMVTYNGLPFDQASGAEQLRVSVSIAMAANPKLRVIRIQDGSLLDDDGIRMIQELAAEKDYQVWLERVDGSGKIGVVMEDGEVAADHQQAEANA